MRVCWKCSCIHAAQQMSRCGTALASRDSDGIGLSGTCSGVHLRGAVSGLQMLAKEDFVGEH